ncbi:hypothetical protein SDC9_209225 [bioreactor metagenome]|uniref:Uncharacterized protein n=1 Tax=bioreactor metagenome TaxID=1076179 RepID=A0A645JCR9_9ZZZZ
MFNREIPKTFMFHIPATIKEANILIEISSSLENKCFVFTSLKQPTL